MLFGINPENKERLYHKLEIGIAGQTYYSVETLNIPNAYNHSLFNSEIDIDTSMPIISMPVRKDKVNSNHF